MKFKIRNRRYWSEKQAEQDRKIAEARQEDRDRGCLTVAELIAELQKQNPDYLVYTEGCDCTGLASEVRPLSPGQLAVSIERVKD